MTKEPPDKIKDEKLTPRQKSYLKKIKEQTTVIIIPAQIADIVWDKVKSFISKFSTIEVEFSNNILQITDLKKLPAGSPRYQYFAERINFKNCVLIKFGCIALNTTKELAERNLKILAYFAKTDKLPYPQFIDGRPII
jgi:ABC-type Zn uptake system ZnuABC Zn-binding protein ZnuA